MKSFDISKQAVWDSYLKVKSNQGAAGVDHQSLAMFEEDLKNKGPQGYLWVKSSSFDRRTPCGQAVDFTPPSLAV